MIYMTFLGVFLGLLIQEKEQEAGPKTPLKKSYRSYFRRAQIRWEIWRSSKENRWIFLSLSLSLSLYIYIYIYAVKLLTGPRLAILIVTNWATLIVTNWATSFSHYKNRGFRWFFGCSVIILWFFQLFFSYLKIAFFKKGVQKLVFSIFSVLSYFFENSLFFGLLKHYKNRGFSNIWVFGCWKRRK